MLKSACKNYHCQESSPRLCPLLWCRRHRTSLLRTFSGCDFLTPHSFKIRQKCKFCGKSGADWKHLLFECSVRDCSILKDIQDRLEAFHGPGERVAKNCLALLRRLWQRAEIMSVPSASDSGSGDSEAPHCFRGEVLDDLLKFVFGMCCTDTSDEICALRCKKVLPIISEITAGHLAAIYDEWMAPN